MFETQDFARGIDSAKSTANRLFEEYISSPRDTAPNGSHTGALASYSLEGSVAGVAAGGAAGLASAEKTGLSLMSLKGAGAGLLEGAGAGLVKGFGAATADAGADMLLQKAFGHNIGGHDIFRPTGLEMLGMGVASSVPMDMRLRLGVAAGSWLAGRVENYFDA